MTVRVFQLIGSYGNAMIGEMSAVLISTEIKLRTKEQIQVEKHGETGRVQNYFGYFTADYCKCPGIAE